MRTSPVLVLVCLLCALPAFGLEPYLVKDINPVPGPADSSPDSFAALGSVALFSAEDGLTGRELWRSDGTAEGTWQVADLCQPDCSGDPGGFARTSRHYFFFAVASDRNGRLWATDGTAAGTVQLTDGSITFGELRLAVGDVLYFTAEDEAHGLELWRSDGTPAGTGLVTDLRPGPEGSNPQSMVAFQGSVWFSADDGSAGGALWRTDGTPAGTVMVKDPVPSSPANSAPAELRVVGSRLVFQAVTPGPRWELWSSDGTARGTRAISYAADGLLSLPYVASSVQGDRLYLVFDDGRNGRQLWVTDGTPKSLRRLTHITSRYGDYELTVPHATVGDRSVFWVRDDAHGAEPWVTDGTPEGTRLLKDLCPGRCRGVRYFLDSALPGRVFLVGTSGAHGDELWVTDGTEAGTRLLRDICRGSCNAWPHYTSIVEGRLVFVAHEERGDTLWSTDGTRAGTVRISNFTSTVWTYFRGTVVGGQLLFSAPGGQEKEGQELWATDGTAAGTRLVRDINQTDTGGSYPSVLMRLGDEAFFFASDGGPDLPLWKSDGTEPGTVAVRRFSYDEARDFAPWTEAAGRLFFATTKGLWRTDGTEAGTLLLGVPRYAQGFAAIGGTVFFQARDGDGAFELWTSDGTVEGTRPVPHGEDGPFEPRDLTVFQGKVFFFAYDSEGGRELWQSDGTEAGTVRVKDILPGESGSNPDLLTLHAGRLWFLAYDGEHGRALWSSDGTAAGTALAVELEPGFQSSYFLVSLGDRLLIHEAASLQDQGFWVTDGTPSGTRKISDRRVTSFSSYTVFKGRLYFNSAENDFFGTLWATDGTAEGTVPVLDQDLRPIPFPDRFAALGDHLLFNTERDGKPLWQTDGTPAGTFRLLPWISGELLRAGSRVFFAGFSHDAGTELWAVAEEP